MGKRKGPGEGNRKLLDRMRKWSERFDNMKKRLQGAGISTLIESLKSPDGATSKPASQLLEAQPRKALPALVRTLTHLRQFEAVFDHSIVVTL